MTLREKVTEFMDGGSVLLAEGSMMPSLALVCSFTMQLLYTTKRSALTS